MKGFSIKLIEGLISKMGSDYKKLIAVIRSMNSTIHINAVRVYINLYYKKNGVKNKDMIEQHFKISDSVGVPSTLGAIILNLMSMFSISNINMLLTLGISALSIIYLLISISIKYRELKKLKKGSSKPS